MSKVKENHNIFDLIPDLEDLKEFLKTNDFSLTELPKVGTEYIGENSVTANSYPDFYSSNTISNWILATGYWRDTGIWIDTEYWKDN